ncbi:MAG: hypothetical protein OEW00_05365 [candidate division Zixibacteria bacterium]|nr:hypothetical protein [candidate division Zixibacteria bacterium]
MKKVFILLGLFLLSSLHQNLKCQDEPERDKQNHVDGYLDHVIATLPSREYVVLDSFLTEHFSLCWMNKPGFGYIVSHSQRPYVELWDAGVYFQGGYQVALASSQENSKESAKQYYGTSGIEFPGGVFNVGKDGQLGDPVGGTFFVDYGDGGKITINDSMKMEQFVGLITSIPVTKKSILNDYKFFNLTVSESGGIYTLKDTLGFTVHIIEQPIEVMAYGHVALQFRLKNDSLERKEYILSKSIKAIFDGKDFVLVLNSRLYDSFMDKE